MTAARVRLWRAAFGALALGVASLVGWGGAPALQLAAQAQTADVGVSGGHLLGSTRFQLAWLDWDAPRPVFLTQLASPSTAQDVAALPGSSEALVSVSSPLAGGRDWGVDGTDIQRVDLSVAQGTRQQPRPVLPRSDGSESLTWPDWWPDGSAIVFQREDRAAPSVNSPDGFARPHARVEIAQADGSGRRVLVDDAWQPSVAPDGSTLAFVRFTEQGSSLLALASADGSQRVLVDPGVYPEIFSPRYSPDGTHLGFGARSYADLMPSQTPPPTTGLADLFALVAPTAAYAHGTLSDVWMMNANGTDLHQVSTLRVHDPSIAWSPDGTQLFAYGAWGGILLDLPSGEDTLMTYLTGTTAVAWLP